MSYVKCFSIFILSGLSWKYLKVMVCLDSDGWIMYCSFHTQFDNLFLEYLTAASTRAHFKDLRLLSSLLFQRQPGLVFDVLQMYQNWHGARQLAGMPGVPWCTCGNCRNIPWDREEPANRISRLLHFPQYCPHEGYLRVHRQYREDVTVLCQAR